ncbi:phosphotransferase enzyme family protein [Pseudonocardia sp. TRM90224]|uniref:phosphotransferase enzyme family protein n=1 Tax=Pseudonocardia sp. TRM90224 TaxID=2812678 RepID=UPI001E3786C7|nr:phosphotransferase [Pseudonocardia sp. TRM90224]
MHAADIAALFDLGGSARLSEAPVARGKQGEVWQLETTDGRWAVKVPFGTTSEAEVGPATRFQEAAHAAGVPTPMVRRTTGSTVLATVGDRQVRVYGWVDLLSPDPMVDPELVGAVIATMHRVPFEEPGELHPWYREPVGAAAWDAILDDLRAAGAPFVGRLAALRDELVALESWIEPPETLRSCHRDLWADNLLPTPDGGLCVIDWENSGGADPSQELACALFEYCRTDPGRARTLTAAYAAAGGPARVTRTGHFSMLIAQLGHITEMGARDWLQPNSRSPDQATAAAWVGEVLDEPHTRRLLTSLLPQ